ncbi:hypothetical protein CDD83_8910 [Cordyceps sp. RAO-2017]|nr:hypothetical protein CDD83_8910 [Cordyceps sp. RAO-2017]
MAGVSGMQSFCVQLSLLVLSLIFTGLRLYVRAVMARTMTADDWSIVVATVLFAGVVSGTMRGATAGAMGQAGGDGASAARKRASLQGVYFCEALWPPLSLAVRLSVCLFLLRIVRERGQRRALHALLAAVAAASLAYLLLLLLRCWPPSGAASRTGPCWPPASSTAPSRPCRPSSSACCPSPSCGGCG